MTSIRINQIHDTWVWQVLIWWLFARVTYFLWATVEYYYSLVVKILHSVLHHSSKCKFNTARQDWRENIDSAGKGGAHEPVSIGKTLCMYCVCMHFCCTGDSKSTDVNKGEGALCIHIYPSIYLSCTYLYYIKRWKLAGTSWYDTTVYWTLRLTSILSLVGLLVLICLHN